MSLQTERKPRFMVMDVYPDGVPDERARFDALEDALDLRDELRKKHPWPGRVHFFVWDDEDPERGQLDHDDLYEEAL